VRICKVRNKLVLAVNFGVRNYLFMYDQTQNHWEALPDPPIEQSMCLITSQGDFLYDLGWQTTDQYGVGYSYRFPLFGERRWQKVELEI
jgi:hypothetical protein